MKRTHFVLLTIFSLLALMILLLSQLHAELTLAAAERLLNNKIIVLNGFNSALERAEGKMDNEEKAWDANEEDITENRIDYASADLLGLGGAYLKQVMDMQDRAEIAVPFGAAIKAVESAKDDADTADTARDLVWVEYVRLADEARISDSERLSKGPDAYSVTYPDVSISCPDCPESWSGSGIGGIADHITSCTVSGHENSSGELVSDPVPHFTCQTCPLSHQHYTFACEGRCGDLVRSPTYLSPPPSSQAAGNMVKIYYDHRRDPCGKKTGLLTTCGSRAFTCQSPECPNDTNHLIKGECDVHEVRKGDTSAVLAHSKLPMSYSQKGRCPVTHDFDGETYQCVLINTYYCDLHDFHDFVDGVGTYPVVSPTPTPTPTDNTPNCPDCTSDCSSPCSCTNSGTCGGTVVDNTSDCSHCTDGCSACPPQMVACGGASWTGCTASVSSRTEHKVSSCSNCGNHYWTCMSGAVDRHTDVKTCKRSGCGASLTRCQNGPSQCINGGYHWL